MCDRSSSPWAARNAVSFALDPEGQLQRVRDGDRGRTGRVQVEGLQVEGQAHEGDVVGDPQGHDRAGAEVRAHRQQLRAILR